MGLKKIMQGEDTVQVAIADLNLGGYDLHWHLIAEHEKTRPVAVNA